MIDKVHFNEITCEHPEPFTRARFTRGALAQAFSLRAADVAPQEETTSQYDHSHFDRSVRPLTTTRLQPFDRSEKHLAFYRHTVVLCRV